MMNVAKVKALADAQGIKYGKVCEVVGKKHTYLNDIAKGVVKNVPDANIFKIAQFLSTSYDYLIDLTDDPDPNYAAKQAESPEEKLIHTMIERVMQLSPEQVEVLQRIFEESPEDFDKALAVWKAMRA